MTKSNVVWLLFVGSTLVLIAHGDNQEDSDTANQDSATATFIKLFRVRRTEQLVAVKRVLGQKYENQYKMVNIMGSKIFQTLEKNRAAIESSGYVIGTGLPENEDAREALVNILENTALIGEIILRLPDHTDQLMKKNNEWVTLTKWGITFSNSTELLDSGTVTLLNLVAQELNLTERDPNYRNPYRKVTEDVEQLRNVDGSSLPKVKPKPPRKPKYKGPGLTGVKVEL